MRIQVIALALAVGLLCETATAGVTVSDPWVRGVVASQTDTGAYMKLRSTTATTLVAVSTPVAQSAQIHEMMQHGEMMMMREIKSLPVAANGTVDLDSSAYHLMLIGLKSPLTVGGKVPLTLTFKDAAGVESTVTVEAIVRPITAGTEHDSMKM